jgi:hypothetical protein
MLTCHQYELTLPVFVVHLIAKSALTVIDGCPCLRCDNTQDPDKLHRFILCSLPERPAVVLSVIFPSDFDILRSKHR